MNKFKHKLLFVVMGWLVANASFAAGGVTLCDTLAGGPYDPNKVAEGVEITSINVSQAEPACKDALASDPANPRLQFEYGRVFAAKGDYASAMIWYTKAADQNYAPALNNIGLLFYNGNGVQTDLSKAYEWFLKSANLNYAVAQENVGFSYLYGEGVAINLAKSFEWFLKAANQNYASAQNNVGYSYETGEGVQKDLSKAFEWYLKAANQDYTLAQRHLARLYYNGQGVAKDLAKAFEWNLKAANLNDASAQNEVGYAYEIGEGVGLDYKKALEWYQKAAEGGEPLGYLNVGALYHNGLVSDKNELKALAAWRKASDMNFAEATFEIILSWAEQTYPTWLPDFAFATPPRLPAPYANYSYRNYRSAAGDIFVAYNPDDRHIYYLGPATANSVVDLGVIDNFKQAAYDWAVTKLGS